MPAFLSAALGGIDLPGIPSNGASRCYDEPETKRKEPKTQLENTGGAVANIIEPTTS